MLTVEKAEALEKIEYLSVDEALALVLENINSLPLEKIALQEALDRVLGEAIYSPVNLPLFNNSAMDGYAIIAADTAFASSDSPKKLQVIGEVAAGEVFSLKLRPGQAIRIMTGASVPEGADAVVKFEDTSEGLAAKAILNDSVEIYSSVPSGQNVRKAGEDFRVGELILSSGTVLNPGCLGLLASVGFTAVNCVRKPRVAIIATGSELMEVGETLLPGKIYNSNNFILSGLVKTYGGEVVMIKVTPDQTELIKECIKEGLAQKPDLIITSGGVSVGDFDLVKQVLGTVGKLHLWQVKMRPGKPVAFGEIGGVPILGLPGNPVAALVSFELFGKAAIRKMLHLPPLPGLWEAVTLETIRNNGGRRSFVRGKLIQSEGRLLVRPSEYQKPSQLGSLAESDCLIIVREERSGYEAGEKVDVTPLYRTSI